MSKQLVLLIAEGISPPRPTMRTEHVAQKIAERLVREVNLDDFYWEPTQVPDVIWDVQQEIMRSGRPETVFTRLRAAEQTTGGGLYGWDGIDDHCRHIATGIATEEVDAAVKRWRERYG